MCSSRCPIGRAGRHFPKHSSRYCKIARTQRGAAPRGPTRIGLSRMRQYAVVADLVVVAIPEQGDPQRAGVLQEALFDTGRPVLAVAATPSPPIFSAPVAIAWKHSAESARALNAALPIIEHVGEAVVLQAGHHEDEAAAQQVLAYLGRRNVRAHALKLGQTGKPGDLVAAKVRELGAGLLVMWGVLSHPRARVRFRRHDGLHAGKSADPAAAGALIGLGGLAPAASGQYRASSSGAEPFGRTRSGGTGSARELQRPNGLKGCALKGWQGRGGCGKHRIAGLRPR